jgi:hypothetical protein
MLRLPFFLAACSLILTVGCSTNSALVPEYMTVSPHLLTYQTADNVHTVALTHSCTCPITWTITKSDSEKWVKVTPSAINDQGNFPVTIDRSLLTRDTSIAYLYVTTNEYKTQSGNLFDTVMIKAIR